MGNQLVPSPIILPKKRKEIGDIITWVECFGSYMSVVTKYNPSRSADLLAYMSLILRTSLRFSGNAWLNYDKAFRQEAAASGVSDWSFMRTDLYNYHTAGLASPCPSTLPPPFRQQTREAHEARGSTNVSHQICFSYNRGRCSSRFANCNFRHVCGTPGCTANHRSIECPSRSNQGPYPRSRSPLRSNTWVKN